MIPGGCPSEENLLPKSPFGQIAIISVNSIHYSPQMIKKIDSKGLPLVTTSILGQFPRVRFSLLSSRFFIMRWQNSSKL